jgi:hypothetical protein
VDDLGVNLAGVEVIINLTEKLELMQTLLEQNQIAVPDATVEVPEVTQPPQDRSVEQQPASKVKIQVRRPRNSARTQPSLHTQTKSNKE